MAIRDLDTAQQAQLIQELSELMGAPEGLITAANLETVATRMFASGQSFDTRSSGTIEDLMNGEMPEATDPQSQWSQMASRAINGRAAAGDSIFLLEALGRDVYGGNFDIDGTLTDQELAELSIIRNGLENGLTIPQIGRDFEVARYEQAQAAAAEAEATLDSQQGVLQIQTQMAALGWIEESDITGEWTRDQARILVDNTYSDMRSQEALIGEHGEQGFLNLTRGAFTAGANPNLTLDIAGANRLLGEFTQGQDFSQIISQAITSGDADQIRIAQGLTGQRITGEWDEASLNAAIEELEGGAITEFPPSMYGQANQLMWGELQEAFQAGTLPLPEGADPNSFALDLMDPASHAAYFEFVASQHDHAAVIAQAQALKTTIGVEAAVQAPAEAVLDAGVEAIYDAGESPYAIESAGAEAALLRSEVARLAGDTATQLSEQEIAVQEMGAALDAAEINFVEMNMTMFRTAGYHLGVAGSEHAAIFQEGTAAELSDFITSRTNEELYFILYDSNTSLYPVISGAMPGAGWQDIVDARQNLDIAREELEAFRALHGETAPVVAPEAEPEVSPERPQPLGEDLVAGTETTVQGLIEEAQVAAATYGYEPGQVDYSFSRALSGRETGIAADPNVAGSVVRASFSSSALGEIADISGQIQRAEITRTGMSFTV
ncbi:MAG: hypothetical protein GW903_04385 [Alphaproteobacteria bacterium]|nr:hypothetical protein [Alphaproteobacteria bacterium]NCQ88207.1 hypothetical protein [Alphaproteobacteria bacterium]NCT05286.1 hypothetical protein [Alphaproteobacteria bacterium]